MNKKIIAIMLTTVLSTCLITKAQDNFSQALKDCSSYEKSGSIPYGNDVFNLKITLNKTFGGKCIYKEKIYQGSKHQTLTCSFDKADLPFLSSSMEKYNNYFKKDIAKNDIFEAKMTTNGEIFQKYLANPKYCQITHSNK